MENNNDKYDLLTVNGFTMRTTLTERYKKRKNWERPNPKEIKAFIPGTIVCIDVKVGEEVKEGQQIMILEAMKMENKVLMPFDGVIKSINVEVGNKIPKHTLMIEIK